MFIKSLAYLKSVLALNQYVDMGCLGKGGTLGEMALAAEAVPKGPICIDCHPSAGTISLSLQDELGKESLCFLQLSGE